MMSVQGEADYLRRSMLAGAREFLVKPFSSDELCAAIRGVHAREREKMGRYRGPAAAPTTPAAIPVEREPGRVITLFSPKGGVGRTTLAVNLAVAMAADMGRRSRSWTPASSSATWACCSTSTPATSPSCDVLGDAEGGIRRHRRRAHQPQHRHPRAARTAQPGDGRAGHRRTTSGAIIDRLRATHDLVVVDCWPLFQDSTLALLDMSDLILVLLTLEITNIKNIRLFLEVADQLGYGSEKLRLVLNRADSAYGIRIADVEHSIGRKVDHTVVSDGRTRGLRPQPRRAVRLEQQAGPGAAGCPRASPSHRGRAPAPPPTTRSRAPARPVRMALTMTTTSAHLAEGRSNRCRLLRRIESARPGAEGALPAPPGTDGARTPTAPATPPSLRRRRRPQPRMLAQVPVRESFREAKFRVQNRLINELDPKLDLTNQVEVRRQIEEIFGKIVDEEGLALTRAERVRMLEQITDEILGLGPLEPLLRDETVTEVMVNGPQQVYIERARQAGADQRDVPERRPRDAHHRPHRRARSAGASTSRARWSTPASPTAPA